MARSLLDTVDLSALRELVAKGPADAVAACLVDAGVLQFDPDDPEWLDRDRVVACAPDVAAALGHRLTAAGADPDFVVTTTRTGGDALALALGAATASRMDGDAWRSWCVLDPEACEDGRVWEVARAARAAGAETLGAFVTGGDSAALWRACGWSVYEAPADDPVWLLGALDQVVMRGPGVVVAVSNG